MMPDPLALLEFLDKPRQLSWRALGISEEPTGNRAIDLLLKMILDPVNLVSGAGLAKTLGKYAQKIPKTIGQLEKSSFYPFYHGTSEYRKFGIAKEGLKKQFDFKKAIKDVEKDIKQTRKSIKKLGPEDEMYDLNQRLLDRDVPKLAMLKKGIIPIKKEGTWQYMQPPFADFSRETAEDFAKYGSEAQRVSRSEEIQKLWPKLYSKRGGLGSPVARALRQYHHKMGGFNPTYPTYIEDFLKKTKHKPLLTYLKIPKGGKLGEEVEFMAKIRGPKKWSDLNLPEPSPKQLKLLEKRFKRDQKRFLKRSIEEELGKGGAGYQLPEIPPEQIYAIQKNDLLSRLLGQKEAYIPIREYAKKGGKIDNRLRNALLLELLGRQSGRGFDEMS